MVEGCPYERVSFERVNNNKLLGFMDFQEKKKKLCSCTCLLDPLLQKTRPYFINIVQNTMCNCSADISHVTDTVN